jgi:hypothetical protein
VSKLLGQGPAHVQEFREDLTGYDHLQQLLTIAWVDNFLGQLWFCPAYRAFCTTTRSWPR